MQIATHRAILQLARRLRIGDGELISLARHLSHNAALVSITQLSWGEGDELLGVLETYEGALSERYGAAREAAKL